MQLLPRSSGYCRMFCEVSKVDLALIVLNKYYYVKKGELKYHWIFKKHVRSYAKTAKLTTVLLELRPSWNIK